MLSFFPSRELRPLKKPRLGAPDVYLQDSRQREDDLSIVAVQEGYKYSIPTMDVKQDSESALSEVLSSLPASELQSSLQLMMDKKGKQEIPVETLHKKRQQLSKDYITNSKLNPKLSPFSQDLAGNCSLSTLLQKKVPVSMRRDEVLEYLWQCMVPISRAVWFIKLNNAYALQTSKKKQSDPSMDWTISIQEFLHKQAILQTQSPPTIATENRDSPIPLTNNNNNINNNNGFSGASQASIDNWFYMIQLCHVMYQDGLLDRHNFLKWLIVEQLDKAKQNEVLLGSYYLPFILFFVEDITRSVYFSRLLADVCVRKLKQLYDTGTLWIEEHHRRKDMQPLQFPRSLTLARKTNEVSREAASHTLLICIKMSAILHCIILECPLSLVWLPNNGVVSQQSRNSGSSPLDKLSSIDITQALPILPNSKNSDWPQQIREKLSITVTDLSNRRHAAETNWSSVGVQTSSKEVAVRELVNILEYLDTFSFTQVKSNKRMLELYRKIFSPLDHSQTQSLTDSNIIHLQCEWAVCPDRLGRHRPLLIAILLWARQQELSGVPIDSLVNEYGDFDDCIDDSELGIQANEQTTDPFPFQSELVNFLDNYKIPDKKRKSGKEDGFILLCILFSELIQREVFSFEQYLRFIVARGDLVDMDGPPHFIRQIPNAKEYTQPEYLKYCNEAHMHQDMDTTPLLDIIPELSTASSSNTNLVSSNSNSITNLASSISSNTVQRLSLDPSYEGYDIKNEFKSETNLIRNTPTKDSNPNSRGSSPKRGTQGKVMPGNMSAKQSEATDSQDSFSDTNSHISNSYFYIVNFPITLEDSSKISLLETQREALLYGVVSCRKYCTDELNRAQREIVDFVRKISNERKQNDRERKTAILAIFKSLPIYHQQNVASKCIGSPGKCKTMPHSRILFIIELLEMAGCVTKLIDFLVDICLLDEESMNDTSLSIDPPPVRPRPLPAGLRIPVVSTLHEYLPTLLFSAHMTSRIFVALTYVFDKPVGEFKFSSDQLRIYLFLNELYNNCYYLMDAHQETFGSFQRSIDVTPKAILTNKCNQTWVKDRYRELIPPLDVSETVQDISNTLKNTKESYSLMCRMFDGLRLTSTCNDICTLALISEEICSRYPAMTNEFVSCIRAVFAPSTTKHGYKDLYNILDDNLLHCKFVIFVIFILLHNHKIVYSLIDNVLIETLQYHKAPEPTESGKHAAAIKITCLFILTLLTDNTESIIDSYYTKHEEWNPLRQLPLYVKHFLSIQRQSIPLNSIINLLKHMLLLQEPVGNERKAFTAIGQQKKILSKTLEQLAGQAWFRESCHVDIDSLTLALIEKERDSAQSGSVANNVGQDKLKPHIVRNLVNHICYPGKSGISASSAREDKAQLVEKMLDELNIWNFRTILIELHVLLQTTPQNQMAKLLDAISNSAFQIFSQKQTQSKPQIYKILEENESSIYFDTYKISPAWLVAPLVSRLTSTVHSRILKAAGDLESNQWWVVATSHSTGNEAKDGWSGSNKQQPFLELILACLSSGSKDDLLEPLYKQFAAFVKAKHEKPLDRNHVNSSLKVRLGLVGSLLIGLIRMNNKSCFDWSCLFIQLLCSGSLDPSQAGTSELYTTTLDMLYILYHSLPQESYIQKDSQKSKTQMHLVERLRRELTDTDKTLSKYLKELYQLLGISKSAFKMTIFNRYTPNGFFQSDMREYNIPAWDVFEGFTNANCLSLSYHFKFNRYDPCLLKYEEQHRLCLLHTHTDKNYNPYSVVMPGSPPEPLQNPPPPSQENESILPIPQVPPSPFEKNKPKQTRKRSQSIKDKDNKRCDTSPNETKTLISLGASTAMQATFDHKQVSANNSLPSPTVSKLGNSGIIGYPNSQPDAPPQTAMQGMQYQIYNINNRTGIQPLNNRTAPEMRYKLQNQIVAPIDMSMYVNNPMQNNIYLKGQHPIRLQSQFNQQQHLRSQLQPQHVQKPQYQDLFRHNTLTSMHQYPQTNLTSTRSYDTMNYPMRQMATNIHPFPPDQRYDTKVMYASQPISNYQPSIQQQQYPGPMTAPGMSNIQNMTNKSNSYQS